MSPYRIAIDETTRAINLRAKYFRNLIVVVVAMGVGSIGWTLFFRTLPPLSGLLLLVPACGWFFVLDGQILNNWRSQLFALWVKKDIDFRALCDTINAVPKLPKDTVRSMLATLPSSADLVAEQRISPVTREAAAATMACTYACQSDRIVSRAVAAAIVAGSVVVAAICRAWQPFWACLSLVSLPPVEEWLKRRRIKRLTEQMLAAQTKPAFSNDDYQNLVAARDDVLAARAITTIQ